MERSARAPYVFPDFVAFLTIRLFVADTFTAIYVCAVLHIAALVIAAALLCRRAFSAPATASIALAVFLFLSATMLVLAMGPWDWRLVSWAFISLAHGSYAIAALLMFCFYERIWRSGSRLGLLLGFVLCTALTFSDRIFALYFSAPYAVVLLLERPMRQRIARLAAFGLSQTAALAIGWFLNNLLSATNLPRPSLNPVESLGHMLAALYAASRPDLWLMVLLGVLAASALLAAGFRRDLSSGLSIDPRAATFVGGMTMIAGALCVPLWTAPDAMLMRYDAASQLGLLLSFALIAAPALRRVHPVPAVFAGVAFVAGLWLVAAVPASAVAPFTVRDRVRAEFAECRERLHLQAGWAGYWTARQLTMTLDWRTQIDQFEPAQPIPYFWGSNYR